MNSITIQITMPTPDQSKGSIRKTQVPLGDRIEYAIDQVIAETSSKKRAIEFLREAFVYLDGLGNPSEEERAMKESIKPVINEYGRDHKGSSQKE
jgi:hypothetical protein